MDEYGAEERFETVEMRLSAEVPAVIDQGWIQPRRVPRMQRRETARCLEKRRDDAFVLLGFARAGGVDQPAARRNHVGGVLEHRQLGGGEQRRIVFAPAPADVGISPQRAETVAERI